MGITRLTVAQRLYAGFGLLLAILVVVTVVAMLKVRAIDHALRANNERNAVIQRHAINFRGSAHDRAIAVRDMVLSDNDGDRERIKQDIATLAAFYAQSAEPMQRMVAAPGAPAELPTLYAGIQAIEKQAVATTNHVLRLVEAGNADAAHELLWSEAKPQYVQWLAAINKLIDFEESLIQRESQIAQAQASSFVAVMLTALAAALVLGGALAWWIPRSIARQLGAEPARLGEVAQRVASGHLGQVSGVEAAAPHSVLASLGAMQCNLAQIVGSVRGASDRIAVSSRDIAEGNGDLSRRTESQATHVQQTTSAMQQLAQTVQANSDTAQEAHRMAGGASAAATKGGEVVGQVVATMQDIAQSSRRIADITGVIDGIAFQTNILALNAAVEAARAGEQGRGFAVVAGEVRTLAQRSAQAAREIKALIGASVEKVDNGSRLVADAGQTMDEIVHQVQRVSELIGRISTATSDQHQGIGEVGQVVRELGHSTQQNASLVQHSASAADSLRQQAESLAATVSVFTLE